MKQYGKRDLELLGMHYFRHVNAMTAEELCEKADIAAELAWRDKRIADQATQLQSATQLSLSYIGELEVAKLKVERLRTVAKSVLHLWNGLYSETADDGERKDWAALTKALAET